MAKRASRQNAKEFGATEAAPAGAANSDAQSASDPAAPDLDATDALRGRYPLTAVLLEGWDGKAPPKGIRICSRREGFRRCGMAHPKTATDHALDRFTPRALEQLLAEPMLKIELV